MNILDLAASPIVSGGIGALASLATGVLGYFQRKQEHAFALDEMRLKMEMMGKQGELDAARLAGELASLRERGAGDAFVASQQAEATLGKSSGWVGALRESTRPLLTWWFQLFTLFIASCIMLGWAVESINNPILQFIVIGAINSGQMTTSWWFGQRQIDKVAVAWGNKTAGARVGPEAKKP